MAMRWVWLLMVVGVARGAVLAPKRLQALLPKSAQVIEVADLSRVAGKGRELALWMESPQKVMEEMDGGSAPSAFYGDHWAGPTRISLVDSQNGRMMKTLPVALSVRGSDEFLIPFWLRGAFSYPFVPNAKGEGRPVILRLQDVTGDGVAAEFVLLEHWVSAIAGTAVLGTTLKAIRCGAIRSICK